MEREIRGILAAMKPTIASRAILGENPQANLAALS
jgi:hypothetical protein